MVNREVTMQYHGSGHVFLTPSSTRLDLVHYTVISDIGEANCTCEGWRSHKKCWHVTAGLERSGIDEEPTDFQVSL